MTYTKGPWRLGRHGSVVSDFPVPEIRGSDDVEYYGGHLVCESVTLSNSRLIALAPTMLELLQSIQKDEVRNSDLLDRIKAVVSKAAIPEVAEGDS